MDAAVSRICVEFRTQFSPVNQEFFSGLKHYRPFCFKDNSHTKHRSPESKPEARNVPNGRRLFAILAIAVMVAGALISAARAQVNQAGAHSTISAEDALQKGKEAVKRGNYALAFSLFREAADQGNALGQYLVGVGYETGLGVPQDYAEAMRWYRKSADQGNAKAETSIGEYYLDGRGVAKDYKQAAAWLRKAADQGDARAQLRLGIMFHDGRGVDKDYVEAALWMRKSADQGNADAQGLLGVFYQLGQGVPQDYAQAMAWLHKAAEQGNDEAQNSIGLMYENGSGVPRDFAQAAAWFRKAAERGNAAAKANLANLDKEKRLATSETARNEVPAAIQYRCALEGMPPSNNARENEQRYDTCLRTNWKRLFGSRPFPGD